MTNEAKNRIRFDVRLVSLALAVIIFAAYYIPLTINIPIQPWTRDFYNTIESLKPGDIVFVNWGWASKPDAFEYFISAIGHLWSKNVKIIWVNSAEAAMPLSEEARKTFWGNDWTTNPKVMYGVPMVYGVNFVFLGWLPAGVDEVLTGMDLLRTPTKIFAVDYFGKPTASMPIIQAITKPGDFKLCYTFGNQYFQSGFGTPFAKFLQDNGIKCVQAGNTALPSSFARNFYNTGYIQGFIAGTKGGYEYSILTGISNETRAYMNSWVFCITFMVIGIIFTNIYSVRKIAVKNIKEA